MMSSTKATAVTDSWARRSSARVFALLTIVIAVLGIGNAQATAVSSLSPGVLIDVDRGFAWVADAGGRTLALKLTDGNSLWRSSEAAFPLTIVDDRLLALGSPGAPGQAVVLLMVPDSGEIIDRVNVDLPDTIRGEVGAYPRGQFEVIAEHLGRTVRIHWQYRSRSAYAPIAEDSDGAAMVEERLAGAVQIDFNDGRASAVSLPADTDPPTLAVRVAAAGQRIAAVPGRQFLAAAGGAVLVSELLDVDSSFPYQWSLYSAAHSRLGSLRAATSRADFIAIGERIYYHSPAYGFRNDRSLWQETAERLVAVDLRSGTELWAVALLDLVYRGPMPP